jgi:hypothetical protein
VLGSCREIGYAKRIEDTADIHLQTVKVAVEMMRGVVIPNWVMVKW